MSLRQVTVGVVGHGSVSNELVCDALNEHFSFGPADAEGYFGRSSEFEVHLMFPVGAERFTQGIESVWQWAVRTEIPFLAVSDRTDFPCEEAVRASLLQPDDWQYATVPETEIVDLLQKSVNPLLLVVTDSGQYTEELRQLAASALSRDIPVYDLGRALLEQGWQEIGVDPDEARGMYAARTASSPEVALSTENARDIAQTLANAYSLLQELRQTAGAIADLQPAIARAERALRAAAAAQPEVPATAQEAPESASEEPPADSPHADADEQPGDTTGGRRTRLEIYDEETDSWRPAGRGRPRQGVRTRRVPK